MNSLPVSPAEADPVVESLSCLSGSGSSHLLVPGHTCSPQHLAGPQHVGEEALLLALLQPCIWIMGCINFIVVFLSLCILPPVRPWNDAVLPKWIEKINPSNVTGTTSIVLSVFPDQRFRAYANLFFIFHFQSSVTSLVIRGKFSPCQAGHPESL